MRGSRSSVVLAFFMLIGAPEARAATGPLAPARVVVLGGELEDLVPGRSGVRALLERPSPDDATVFGAVVGMDGLEPLTPFLQLPADAGLHGGRLLPEGGALAAYNTRGDGYVGNELRVVVDSDGTRLEQRVNSASTQASALYDSIAVGPTGTLAVPFTETVLPYGSESFANYVIAVRPPAAAAFSEPQPIFPRGAQGYDVMNARTFLGRDGGGWVFLLPDGDDWQVGEPVIVLARRIESSGRLGVLLRLPVPITRPVNTNVSLAAKFNEAGRLIAAFSGSGYEHGKERAVVWTHTFAASTTTVPRRSMIVDRGGGYGYEDNVDLQLDANGRAVSIAQTRGGLRLFRQRGGVWTPGPRVTTTRHTWTARLLRPAHGRTTVVWLQPYNPSGDRAHLMLATGPIAAHRWQAYRVPGIGRRGLLRLDAATAYGDDGIAAAVYARDGQNERLVLTTTGH